ncbi:g726 [Coccomyxa elongata]
MLLLILLLFGNGKASHTAPAFFPIIDYAPLGCFDPPNTVVEAYTFVERYFGSEIDTATDALLKAFQNSVKTDRIINTGSVVHSYRDVRADPDVGAAIFTSGGPKNNGTSNNTFPDYSGVQMTSKVYWDSSSTIFNTSHYDSVHRQQYYTSIIQLGISIQIQEAWTLRMTITPETAAIWARLPMGNLTGMRISAKLQGAGVAPFFINKQNLFMKALFEPLSALCSVSTAELTQVNETSGVLNETTVTLELAVVYNECRLTEAMNLAMQNATFKNFMASAGLPIDASEVVRANMLPGPSVLQQAAKMGYPSTVYTTPQIASVQVYQNPDEELVGALCGSILFSSILVGLLVAGFSYHRRQRSIEARQGPSYDILKVDLTGDMLGHGRFGKVYKGVLNRTCPVAVKVVDLCTAADRIRFHAEVSIMQRLSDQPHIVKCYEYNPQPVSATSIPHKPMLVMELMEGGDLHDALHLSNQITWNTGGKQLAAQIALGLHELHLQRVVHCDIKPRNILLNAARTQAKIGDVGLARIMIQSQLSTASHYGTLSYAAPEVLLRKKCSSKVDIFSLGVVLWEMVTNQVPDRYFFDDNIIEERHCCGAIAALVTECTDMDPERRPSAIEVHQRILSSMTRAESDGWGDQATHASIGALDFTQSVCETITEMV